MKLEQETRIEEARKWISGSGTRPGTPSLYIISIINSCEDEADRAFLRLKYSDVINEMEKEEESFKPGTVYIYNSRSWIEIIMDGLEYFPIGLVLIACVFLFYISFLVIANVR